MNNQSTIKIHAYLAQIGIASRRQAEQLIIQKKVKINGKLAIIGQRIDPQTDQVEVDSIPVSKKSESKYYLVNKPPGYVSTVKDEKNRPTVLSLLPKLKERVYPVGRLDIESEGLIMLTNDGTLTHQLTHPSFEIPKSYQVLVAGRPTSKALAHLKRGVKLKEGYAIPVEVKIVEKLPDSTWLEITILQGFNRQIRRMMERVGYETIRLIRIKMGPFHLEQLENKPFIELTASQIPQIID